MKPRLTTALVGLCLAVLAGCGPAAPELADAPIAIAGLRAYRNGDHRGLKAAIAALSAKAPADPRDPALLECSLRGFALRRAARMRNELIFLDKSTAFAAGETGRFVFLYARQFQGAGRSEYWRGRGIEPVHGGGPDCHDHPDRRLARATDRVEQVAYTNATLKLMTQWENELRLRWGETEFERRMQAAVKTLHAAHLSETDRWHPVH